MPPSANYVGGDATLVDAHTRPSPSSMRRRNPMACLFCRRRKIKCEFNNSQDVCDHCHSKNSKCTVLSVAQEEALKAGGYADDILISMDQTNLELLLRQLQLPNSTDYAETHLITRHPHIYGQPSSPQHALPSPGQNIYHSLNSGNRVPYNNSTPSHHIPSRPDSTTTAPINTPHPPVHTHHQSNLYPVYTSPSPDHRSYQIPAPSLTNASPPHHIPGDHHQLQQLRPNIPTHSNARHGQDQATYSGQSVCPFQPVQQPNQGQTASYQYYSSTTSPGYTHDGAWRR